jgi:hypothetical protein
MTKLTYEWTNGKDSAKISSLPQAQALVESKGGQFKLTYEPILSEAPKNPAWKNPKSPWYAVNHQ